jgi:RNA polymerase sigma-70 factor (ECF subfamily)
LLDAWREGDTEAGNQLFQRHFQSVLRFFQNKVGDAAQDLVQQTFLSCVEGRDRFRKQASFRTYLFCVARYRLNAHIARIRKHGEPEVEDITDPGTSPSLQVARFQEKLHLVAALRTLPLDYQIALELYYWEGLSTNELAKVLSIPSNTVRSRLHRARQSLRDALMSFGTMSAEMREALREMIEEGEDSLGDDPREVLAVDRVPR